MLFDTQLDKIISQLRDFKKDNKYYLFILWSDGNKIFIDSMTHFTGYKRINDNHVELRKPRQILGSFIEVFLQPKNIPFVIINKKSQINLFFLSGGIALIDSKIAESNLKSFLKPEPAIIDDDRGFGYKSIDINDQYAFIKAPKPKLRMKIIKRDGYKCKVCGRSPDTNSDIELHVHHIRPWQNNGLTIEANLITLCHTCHNGLDPHFERGLFRLIKNTKFDMFNIRHLELGVKKYRNIAYDEIQAHYIE